MEKFIIIFSRIDNQAMATFNGSSYDSGLLQDDPIYAETGHSFEIQPLPSNSTAYPLELLVKGYNSHFSPADRQQDPNPFHIAYKIVKRNYDAAGNINTEIVLFDINDFRPLAKPNTMLLSHIYIVTKDSVSGNISIARGN